MKKTKGSQILSLFSLAFSLYLNIRQLKRMSFIWNAFNSYINEENKKFPNSLCLFFFSLLLLSIYISMFLCKFHTQFRKKTRERESFQSLFLNKKLYYSYFLSFIIVIFFFVLEHFFFHYISIVILYVFFF
jgi:hypothetical protein